MKLSKRTYGWLLLAVLLVMLGWLANRRSQSAGRLEQYARQLSAYYQHEEALIAPLLEDSIRWEKIFQRSRGPYTFPSDEEVAFLRYWSDSPIVWMLFADSIPIFWTDNTLLLPKQVLSRLYQNSPPEVTLLNAGYYVLKSRRISAANTTLLVMAAIPIKQEYPVSGPYLRPGFTAGLSAVPDNIFIGAEGEEPVTGPDGSVLFYLSRGPGMLNRTWHLLGLGLYLLGFLFLALFLNTVANALGRKSHPWLGAAFIIAVISGTGLLSSWLGLSEAFAQIPFFRHTSGTFILKQSLGTFFISSFVLLWLMVFFHREFQAPFQGKLSTNWAAVFTILTYALSIICLLVIIRLFQSLVLESELVFDFQYIFGLDLRTLLALVSGLVIMLAFFLFNHRLMQATSRLGLNLPSRLGAAVAALIISWPVFYALQLDIPILYVLMMAIVYVLGLDFTIDRPSISLTAAVSWLLFFAICSSIIIYHFRQKQDLITQYHYAQRLGDPKDEVFEGAVGRLQQRLDLVSRTARQMLRSADALPLARDTIYPAVQTVFDSEPYLFQHYEFEIFGIGRQGEETSLLIRGQRLGESMRLLESRNAALATGIPDLYYWPKPNAQGLTYLLDLAPADPELDFWMAFRPRSQAEQRVYGELLSSTPYKGLSQLSLYDYAIYGDLQLIKQAGKVPANLRLPSSRLAKAEARAVTGEDRLSILYRSEQDLTVLLSRQKEGQLQALSLFSFIFTLLVLLTLLLSVLNYYWQALPNTLEFSGIYKASLRNRIQRAILLLILGSFILVGFVTAAFFQQNALRAGSEQLNEKAQAVVADLQRNIAGREEPVSSLQFLNALVEPIADIHNMDINIYNLHGQLQLTSAEYLFQQGITAPLMNPLALQALRQPTQSAYRSEEQIGELVYQSAYVPIRDGNQEIIAYLELPYYANDRELQSDLQSFLSALLNVYVFLLLVSGAIALFVADSITQPISKIGQKLSQFRLGYNEPLEWKSPDEIGQLIGEYNLMINKLEESAEKLRQSEREGAWREMAKQVAHEIKNPLTPMKLNMQHLLRVQQQDPERAGNMLSEVAQSIIQQIDGLSRIAGEFSDFAKMPQAENEYFVLNKLVSSVFQLYARGDHGDTVLQLDQPDEPLEVLADSTQLMRVINNLIKNALQAIPDEQAGKVRISLKREKDKALFSVSDNGSGIPESLREKVFFPNFTTKNSGMGLGLAMSRSIVNSAGGRIYFETEEGRGTTFFVELPLASNKAGAILLDS